MAGTLGVSRSGYYAWKNRPMSTREQDNQELLDLIKELQEEAKYRYGSPRLTVEIRKQWGTSARTVWRILWLSMDLERK